MKNENLSVSMDERLGQWLSRALHEETEMNPEECPTPLTMAAFIEGGLEEEPRRQVTAHVSRCSLCREWIGELSRVQEELPDLIKDSSGIQHITMPAEPEESPDPEKLKTAGGLKLAFSRHEKKQRIPGISGLSIPQWAGLAASLLLVIGVAWFVSRQPGSQETPLAHKSLNARVIAQRLPSAADGAAGSLPREVLGFSATGHQHRLHFQSGQWLASLAAVKSPVDPRRHLRFTALLDSAQLQGVNREMLDELPRVLAGKTSQNALLGWISRFEKQIDPESWPYVLLGEWCYGAERAAKVRELNYFRPAEIRAFSAEFRDREELPGLLRSLERLETLAEAAADVPGRFVKIAAEVENLILLFE